MCGSSRYVIITASKSRRTDISLYLLLTNNNKVCSLSPAQLHRPLMMDNELIHKARRTGVTQGRVMLQREIKLLISK